MRWTFVFSFVALLTLSHWLRLTELIRFQIEHKHIVAELCVQRDAEVNTCNGKCHLKQQMQQIEAPVEPATQEPAYRISLPELLFTLADSEDIDWTTCIKNSLKHTASFSQLHDRLIDLSCFHPPCRS
jgi:hypothetical protein